ncbi:MAG: hypothetical protein HKN59_06400 [Gammaproteobacteria bacterium]|nr:hypothetical protein [Gammaproteobacteria bacterium]
MLSDIGELAFERVLRACGLRLKVCADGAEIPGSYWGAPEAGLVGGYLYARRDTPAHSVLHEASHYVCMSPGRRADLHTDAGGSYEEECCVCYLQIILSESVPGLGRERMFKDMDTWGYSFRLGSAQKWFEGDAGDSAATLRQWGLTDSSGRPTWRLRGESAITGCDASRA